MGKCAGECRQELYRGDSFVITLADNLYCLACWSQVPGIGYPTNEKGVITPGEDANVRTEF